ncbi:hypothetical protein [uncultured Roseobacter sp.]|uniref:hypothetical protein n=1 Tax=uncultured Roseobacter sp. TaxID=114847 RepID=UPI0026040488|nr:hypothetical protein [uncultured Roseobacter sp.]
MSPQQQRQIEQRTAKPKLQRPGEIFTFTPAHGPTIVFDVTGMRAYAERYLRWEEVSVDLYKVNDMLKKGQVDLEHLQNHTLLKGPKPLIVCNNILDGMREIVDGNHTYVAMAIAHANSLQTGQTVHMLAYHFEREQWEKFLIG